MKVEDVVANVHWPEAPVTRSARSCELIRVQPYHPVYGWCINHQVTRMWIHWDGATGWPHLDDAKACPGCRQGMPLREKAYMPILLQKQPKTYIIELTEKAMRNDALLSSPHTPLRGRDIRVERATSKRSNSQHKRSPLKLTWGPIPSPKQLPSPFDIRPTLLLIFGMIPDRHGDVRFPVTEGGAA